MKLYRQQKRKLCEITNKQDECMGASLKKSAIGAGRGHQKATECIRKPHLEHIIELQVSSQKIKLQLFPIDEQTRQGLEKDGYNPFVELTLSPKKRISSVVRHLSTKWGSSRVATGQLMLFPYNTKLEQLTSSKRWTSNDSAISAWEVFADIGSSSFFRLRYGWCSNLDQVMVDRPPKSSILDIHRDPEDRRGCSNDLEIPNHQERIIDESCEAIKKNINMNAALRSNGIVMEASDVPTGLVDNEVPTDAIQVHSTVPWDDNLTNLSIGGLLSEISMQGKINGSDPSSANKSGLISDMSFGDLLSESSLLGKMSNPSMQPENESSSQPIFLSFCDISIGGLFSEASLHSTKNKLMETRTTESGHAQIQSPWNDSFTSLSIGGLLSEASLQAKIGGNPKSKESKSSLQHNAPSPNIFGSLNSSQQNSHSQMPKPSCNEPSLSILDAEETCHAFPIRKLQANRDATISNGRDSSTRCRNGTISKQFQFPKVFQINNEAAFPKDSSSPRTEDKSSASSLGNI